MNLPRSAAATLAAALLISGCGSTTPSVTPRPSASAGAACAPNASGAATTYPGWPGNTDPEILPLLVSSELAVGPDRFLVSIADKQNKLVSAADVALDLRFFDLAGDPATPRIQATGSFIQTAPGRGLYRANVTFTCAGDWGVELVAHKVGTADRTVRGIFQVRETTQTPPIGSRMPAFDTPTLKPGTDIKTVTTDPSPDADFYSTSVRQALTDKRPFLLVLATPAFCKTATCGPALDLVQAAAAPFKDKVTFIQVEPYQMRFDGGSLQPVLGANGELQPIQMVDDLGLVTEPYTFAVDRNGLVVAKFEGVMGRDELDQVLGQLSK